MPHYDYSLAGGYFLTISTHSHKPLFGRIANEEVELNALGRIAQKCWTEIPEHFANVSLETFIVMPNHVHGILLIGESSHSGVGAQHAAPLRQDKLQVKPGSLGAIVRSYKAAVTKAARKTLHKPGLAIWQRNYYERVIRDERELEQMRFYILHNALPH
ncbi:MAG: hypothetical protein KJZ53_07820 [Anaerolineales bacterium]|nr:hypothetical protein [Anaerolineales bacterium]